MIYIDSSIVYVPKSSITQAGNSIRLINGITKEVFDASIFAADFYYRLTDNRLIQLQDGQYNYAVYTDDTVYDSGIAQKGQFKRADTSIYDNKITFITYGN